MKFAQRRAATTPRLSSRPSSASTRASPRGGVFDLEIVEQRSGLLTFRATGKGALETFKDEPGGHRWQQIPPNERKGRVHTSTITVAVLPEPTPVQVVLRDQDLEYATCRGSGAGGQHRNKTESAVQLKHLPSGLMVRCESERSQDMNKETARQVLRARLWQLEQDRVSGARADNRRAQVGSGQRGDKRRTIRTQDDSVADHVTGRTWKFRSYVRGLWD